jgi:mannose/fructose-specific phosphotransferase system component IIA
MNLLLVFARQATIMHPHNKDNTHLFENEGSIVLTDIDGGKFYGMGK